MSHPALRSCGALLVFLLAASPAETVAATAKSPPAQRVGSATRHRTTAAHTRSRRLRRPPGGVVWARNAILLDPYTDSVLYEKNSETPAPIASLTKLMTVMVFLEQNPDLRRPVEVTREELRGGGHTQLRNREEVPLYDLLHMSLMCSDNVATRVLARESGLTADEFVGRMNRKAKDLGLEQTRFVEPTGLDERNVSTAADVARLLRVVADNTLVREITTTDLYLFRSSRRPHQIVNTDRLLKSRYCEVNCGKTGFILESGYCVATWVRARGRDLIAVVLGAPTNATRFTDVVRLVQYCTPAGVAASSP